MRVFSAIPEITTHLKSTADRNNSIGLVPTMGALHKGHLKLIERSKNENTITVVSIFINPLQFNNSEDLINYPRGFDDDLKMLEGLDVDVVFAPGELDMYPEKPLISMDFGNLAKIMEGEHRKGHFDGVGIIVSKLLNIVQPTSAYFGLKDLQQYLLIKRMCIDLNFPCKIIGVETEREPSGLAMSSRNRRLSNEGLKIAANIYTGLSAISKGIDQLANLKELVKTANNFYTSIDGLKIEYLEVVDASTLEKINSYKNIKELAVCVAGYVEGIRLIDNLYLRLK